MALLALATMTSSSFPRDVNAIRSSSGGGGVDRDFLRAHFQAHLLQRDWLPRAFFWIFFATRGGGDAAASCCQRWRRSCRFCCFLLLLLPMLQLLLPLLLLLSRPRRPLSHDTHTQNQKVLFVTAIYGDYEKTLKEPAQQQHPADFVAFTDRKDLASPTWNIRLVEDPLDYLVKHGGRVGVGGGEVAASEAAGAAAAAADIITTSPTTPTTTPTTTTTTIPIDGINSLTHNRHPFNLAKVFKMQFYRFFDLSEYRAAVWLDATIQLIGPQTAGLVFHLLAQQRRNFVTFEHNRQGLLSAEAEASKTEKYEGTHWGCCDQPFQNVTRQYEEYLQQGFKEKWWLEEYDAPLGISKRPEWGLWVTSFVALDLHSPASFEFLDAWWQENVVHSTQDQVSFPFVAWKMKVYPFSLPSPGVSEGPRTIMISTKRLCTACGGDSSHQQLLIANEELNPLANCSVVDALLLFVPVTALMTGPDDTVRITPAGRRRPPSQNRRLNPVVKFLSFFGPDFQQVQRLQDYRTLNN